MTAAIAPDNAAILYSPYNWDVTSVRAQSINPGAYFKVIFTGASCTLNFDITSMTAYASRIAVFVDGRFQQYATLSASTVAVSIQTYINNTTHLLEVVFCSCTQNADKWNSPWVTAVKFTGMTLPTGGTVSAPIRKPRTLLIYGDSITEGVRTLMNYTTTPDCDNADSTMSWAYFLSDLFNAEVGIVGFGGTGVYKTGWSSNVPALQYSWNYLWNGQARTFTPEADLIIWQEGTNDYNTSYTVGGTVYPAVTDAQFLAAGLSALNGMLAAMPTSKAVLFRPFAYSYRAAGLQNIRNGCSNPARVTYVDTNGYYDHTNTAQGDGTLHPYGWTDKAWLAPKMAQAILDIGMGALNGLVFAG